MFLCLFKAVSFDFEQLANRRDIIAMTVVKLNVGGTLYTTSLSTLTMKEPGCMLARMVDQPQERQLIEEGKELFIDRNRKLFEYILEVRIPLEIAFLISTV